MTVLIAAPRWLVLRLALRDLRGGLRGFYVFMACIALGTMAIAGVGAVAASLNTGLAREGRLILGGDAVFSLFHREADTAERAFLAANGDLSVVATMRAMARSQDGRTALVEMKAVDSAYPLVGSVGLDPAQDLSALLAQHGDAFGAAADPALLARLELVPGARITLGSAVIEIRAALVSEPDKLAGGIGFGPRLLVGADALRASGLIQPGSLVRWHYRLRLPENANDTALQEVVTTAAARFPQAGWEVRTRSNASPSLTQSIERFTQYLTLVGLAALLVGGIGVANAIKAHLDRKREGIATLKSLGATGQRVFAIYLVQILVLAVGGALPGAALGGALPFVLAWGFGSFIPLPLAPALHPGAMALAVLYGVLTALAFALWPLGGVHDISVAALFRDVVESAPGRRRRSVLIATALVVALLAGLAIATSYDRRIAAMFVAAATIILVALRLIAWLVMAAARRLPHVRSTALRLAIANVHRPGALTPSVLVSLGLGLALLVTVVEIDGNLRRQFLAALPANAPAFFFLDIQRADAPRFDAFVAQAAPQAKLERVPMLRGRIVAANGVAAEELKPAPGAAWVLQSDRGITYADQVPAGSRLVQGEWWGADYQGPPLVSLEQKIAEGLGLKIGDPITVNVLGRNITARIANLRAVDWENLGINFVLVYSPNTFRSAPHTDIATLTFPGRSTTVQEIALVKAATDAFPSVTAVRVREAIEAVAHVVSDLLRGIRAASGLTLLTAALVLGGALAAAHRRRVYEAVVLRTLGASRMLLVGSYVAEYAMIGLASAVFGVAAGSVAALLVVNRIMNLPFTWLPGPALATAAGAVLVTVVLGLIGTFAALGQKPAPILRNL